jgi:hypothetical protein
MKERMKYERPALIDLSAETAAGAICLSGDMEVNCYTGNIQSGTCYDGSCVIASMCQSGTAANMCNQGTRACAQGVCKGCCTSGTNVVGGCSSGTGYGCYCTATGSMASWQCNSGGVAEQNCGTGSYDYFLC